MPRKPGRKIESGERFGRVTVLGPAARKYHLQCVCDCGHRFSTRWYNLLRSMTTQCIICSRKPKKDFVGGRFGKWTVVKYLGQSRWKCRCDCGTERVKKTCKIGDSKSCLRCAKPTVDEVRLNVIRAAISAGIPQTNVARVLKISDQRVSQILAGPLRVFN